MKKNFKRILSMILVLCTLLSAVPCVALAAEAAGEGTQTEPVKVVYDFQLEQTALTNNAGNGFAKAYLAGAANQGAIADYYRSETLNWKYAAENSASFKEDTNAVSAMLYFGGDTNLWKGLRFGVLVEENGVKDYPAGHWTALTIRVPATGVYDLTLNHQTRGDGASLGEIYFLEGTYADIAGIEAAMAANAQKKTVNFTDTTNTIKDATAALGKTELKAGEYTVVFKAAGKRNGAGGAYIYLRTLEMELMEQTEEPELTTIHYDFTLAAVNAATGAEYKNKYFFNLPDSTISSYYAAGTLNWKLAVSNKELLVSDTYPTVDSYLSYGNGTTWAGLRLAVRAAAADGTTPYLTGHWFAFTLKSPGTGSYDITLNYQTRNDGNQDVKVYLLEGELTDAAAIQTAIESADSLTTGFDSRKDNAGTVSTTANPYLNGTKNLGTYALTDNAYTLVVHSASASGASFFLSGVDMTEHLEPEETTAPEQTTAPEDTTAPEEEVPALQVDSLTYDFKLGASELTATDGKTFAGGVLDAAKNKDAVAQYYASGALYWKYALDNLASFKTETNSVGSTFYIGNTPSFKWSGIRLGVLVEENGNKNYPNGYYLALTIQSPGKGNYRLSLDYQTRADGTPAGEVYLIKGTFADNAALEAAMTRENLRKVVDFTGKTFDMTDPEPADLGVVAMEQCEYTVVFKATKSSNAAHMYIDAINAVKTADAPVTPELPEEEKPVEITPQGYNFALGTSPLTDINGAPMAGATLTDSKILQALDGYYAGGLLSWKYAADNVASFGKDASNTFYVGNTASYKWSGLRMGVLVMENGEKTYPEGWWTAMTIQSPGKGLHYLFLDYQTRADGTPEGEVYLIKGKLTDSAEIEKAMTQDNLLQYVKFKSKTFTFADAQAELGAVNFEEGEYTLVFKATQPSGSAGAYMYINRLTATHESMMPPPGPNVVTYDFDLNDSENGIYDGKELIKDKIADLSQRYSRGKLNWKYQDKAVTLSEDAHAFAGYAGMILYTTADDWMAFKCKSPGKGLYTLTMNYATSANGAVGAVYILPGDTKDIEKAMDHSNRISKVAYYNDSGSTTVKDGASMTLGTWEFGNEEEFIIVFEAYGASPYKSNVAYQWISQVIATEGNHTTAQTANRKVNSIVVASEAVKTFETTQYGTTAVVNGQDYLFIATEGKKMIVYNLDDMVKVATVRTPFTVCRGMTTDSDGMIWLVGDKPVVFRYDPYTGATMTSRNFGGEIPECYGGFSCTTDADGNLYFGSYQRGAVVKYIPAQDKFYNMGEYNNDGFFSCGVVVHEDYLYVGTTGDRNADGIRSTEMLKINKDTFECVDRLDITEQVGPDEVMVRDAGIAGDTLFVGGISMDAFIAIDIHTMELKHDYDVSKMIAYGPSEVKDGKCYFPVQSTGFFEYDIASDKVTKIKGMDTATSPLRCGDHSFVTLDDPLYPGDTMVTFRSEAILLYNVESGNVGYITELFDEEADGSGMVCRPIVNGPAGSNELYLGAFNTVNCAVFNTQTGQISRTFEAVSSQTDAILWYEDVLYTGNYNNGSITRINMDDPDRNVILLSMNNDLYEQNRVTCLTAGDGMIFAGTTPRTDTYGGALAVVDLKTLERTVERNIVQDCSVIDLVFHDGYVYGATSVSGGTGTEGAANDTVSAKIFVYDAAGKKKVGELDLRDHISGLPGTIPMISGIEADPNVAENGKFWGMVSETLFSFTFDAETGEFTVREELSFGKTTYLNSPSNDFAFKNGYMYAAFGNTGGLRKINLEKVSDNIRLDCEVPADFTIAEDGNLYYSIGTADLKMYPLDVTDEDWAAAEAVDALINAIGGSVTLEHEEAILAARAAYDALSLKRRALVQCYDILQIAETDLIEAKIDSIGEVTLDSRALIEYLLAAYEALPAKEQRYVKNYAVLVQADLALQKIIDAQKAAEMQKLIDSIQDLGEITLEDEEAIKAIREAYDALTFNQKLLVDNALLLDAEAKIKALRQERIDRLVELIASIGDVTLEDEPVIVEAMEIFDWLTLDERNQVDYLTLNAAEKALKKLQKTAAEEVDGLIAAIGNVSIISGGAIKAARTAYDALTDGSKAYVESLSVLEAAETAFAGAVRLTVIICIGVAVLAGGAVTVILIVNKRKK